MIKIEFKDVGRGKLTWTAEVKELTERLLVNAIKKKKALMSSDIGVAMPLPGGPNSGPIFAGMHVVGAWREIK